ncbi:MAG TPA: long-chain-fatty-acid--CoA ligase [Thermodesulfobacteriota bacterium]|nr:long-chain-fatty-acid--CoA ligase [Thermodesulfobacteriota bacterium]
MIISDFIEKARKLYPKNEAIICNNVRLTYEQFYERTRKLAICLQSAGIRRGDVVSILHFNCHCYMEVYFAAAGCGAILNSINVRLSPREIDYILKDSDSRLLISNQRYAELLRKVPVPPDTVIWTGAGLSSSFPGPSYEDMIAKAPENDSVHHVEVNEDDIAHLYYTSGTTGKAKGVPLSHRNVTFHSLCALSEFAISESDNWLHAAPLFHLADAWATFAFTLAGARHTMLNDFDEQRVFELIETERVTITNMIPTMLNMLIHAGDVDNHDFSSLRVILSGGASIAPTLVRSIMEKFGCEYIQTYGMTETSPYLTISKLKDHLRSLPVEEQLRYKAKTGREYSSVSLRVVREDNSDVRADGKEIGEITVKGDSVTQGYWKLPEETAKAIRNGWLYTGDMATIDSEGYVNIVDRKKDMIITGGENVYSTEVEHVIYEHPAVLEVAVIGVPDETWGETVKAFVVLKKGMQATGEDITAFVRERIAHFKAPRQVAFLDSLPRTGSGKITKQVLRDEGMKN